jgi:hypothetical protein
MAKAINHIVFLIVITMFVLLFALLEAKKFELCDKSAIFFSKKPRQPQESGRRGDKSV